MSKMCCKKQVSKTVSRKQVRNFPHLIQLFHLMLDHNHKSLQKFLIVVMTHAKISPIGITLREFYEINKKSKISSQRLTYLKIWMNKIRLKHSHLKTIKHCTNGQTRMNIKKLLLHLEMELPQDNINHTLLLKT